MKFFLLNEDASEITDISELSENKEYHFYGNSKTGVYYFNGTELVRISDPVVQKIKRKKEDQENPMSPEEDEERKGRLRKIKQDLISGKLVTSLETDKLFYGSDDAADLTDFQPKASGSKQELVIDSIKSFMQRKIGTVMGWGYGKDSPMALTPDTIKKVRRRTRKPQDITISLYFDRSGSWRGSYVSDFGNDIVATLREFENDRSLNNAGVHVHVNVYYFAVHVWPDESVALSEGNNGGEPIIQHMIETHPDNVIIMTDSDISNPDDSYWWPNHKASYMKSKYVAPGGVWAIFIGGVASTLIRGYGTSSEWHLAGEEDTKVFELQMGEK